MYQFTIYQNPLDAPGQYVVRRWTIGPGWELPDKTVAYQGPSLSAARAAIPYGLHRMPRFPDDDPSVLEVWL